MTLDSRFLGDMRYTGSVTGGLMGSLDDQPLNPMLSLLHLLRNDTRTGIIDLGIGVYRDVNGRTPVMRAVKAAEGALVSTQASKSYVAAEGDAGFVSLLAPVVFGDMANDETLCGLQTPGGTGALCLAAALIHRLHPQARVWIGTPTWPNHASLMQAADLAVADHPFFDTRSQTVVFDAMMDALQAMLAGDVLLLHGCCHNPTGAEFTADQWRVIGDLVLEKGVVPLIDMAYQGLGHGLDEDAANARALLARVPEAIVAVSCSKNFGLYRDRIGALWIKGPNATAARRARDMVVISARTLWSMPPDHGAAVVRTILSSPELAADWRVELGEMRTRINTMRTALAQALPQLPHIADQTGMFGLLPLSREAVLKLRADHGIYMIETGRINIAGLHEGNLEAFAAAACPYLNSI